MLPAQLGTWACKPHGNADKGLCSVWLQGLRGGMRNAPGISKKRARRYGRLCLLSRKGGYLP